MSGPLWDGLGKLRVHMGSLSSRFAADAAASTRQPHLPTLIITLLTIRPPHDCSARIDAALLSASADIPGQSQQTGRSQKEKAETFDSH